MSNENHIRTGIPTLDRKHMSKPTVDLQAILAQNNQLQEQLRMALGRIGDLEKQEKARTASVYKSGAGNLTFSWRKAGVFRSFLIPAKSPDGKMSIARCGNVPADIRLAPGLNGGSVISVSVNLPVDSEEAQLFNQAFTMQNQVVIQSKTRQDGQQTATTATAQTPTAQVPQWTPAPPIVTAPTVDPNQLVAEAQKLIDSGVPFASLADAVASVKKAKGLA